MNKYLLLNAIRSKHKHRKSAYKRAAIRTERQKSKNFCRDMMKSYDFDDSIKVLSRPRRQEYRIIKEENPYAIYSFLKSKVGQPWNDIYSEICEVGNKRSKRIRRAINLVKMMVLGWNGNQNTSNDSGFHVDEQGILQYLAHYQVKENIDRKYPSKEKIHRFVGAYRSYYSDKKIDYERKIIRQGARLFWGVRTRSDYYLQTRELRNGEYRFFLRLNSKDQEELTFTPVVKLTTSGGRKSTRTWEGIFGFSLSDWYNRTKHKFEHECGLSKKEWCDPRVKYVYPIGYNYITWRYLYGSPKKVVVCG